MWRTTESVVINCYSVAVGQTNVQYAYGISLRPGLWIFLTSIRKKASDRKPPPSLAVIWLFCYTISKASCTPFYSDSSTVLMLTPHLCVWALRPFRSGHRTPKKDLSYGTRLGPQRDIENDIVASILSFQVVFFGNSRHVGLVQLLTPIGWQKTSKWEQYKIAILVSSCNESSCGGLTFASFLNIHLLQAKCKLSFEKALSPL